MLEPQQDLVGAGWIERPALDDVELVVGEVDLDQLHPHDAIDAAPHHEVNGVVARLVGGSPRPADQTIGQTDAVGLPVVSWQHEIEPALHREVVIILQPQRRIRGVDIAAQESKCGRRTDRACRRRSRVLRRYHP